MAGTDQIKVYTTTNWWSQIKTAGAAIYANRHYLKLYQKFHPGRLAKLEQSSTGNGSSTTNGSSAHDHAGDHFDHETKAEIIADVHIHPSASIHPTAVVILFYFLNNSHDYNVFVNIKIGPNVSIGKNVTVGPGARIKESIVLNNSSIGKNSLVMHTVRNRIFKTN